MKEKTRKIFIMIVMAALIVSLTAASFAALTYGRYTGGKLDEDSPYEEIIDFVGATAFEVTSPDAFINAINNGYSYIKIADDAEEPFVINNNVADVYTNLVLDVNGHVVVRNSRNPLLDVRRSISVVLVYDSSTDADGGFYNPVGSSLQTSGGTLTVGEGVYESGPKIESVPLVTTAEISDVFVRNGGRASATKYQKATAAAQLPKPGQDVYLDETYSGTKNDYLKADTYLLYTVEKNGYVDGGQLYVNAKKDVNGTVTSAEEFSPICNVASCDFYYYYPVGEKGTENSPQTYAVVYGYNDVKALARDEKKTDENGIEYGMASALTGSGLVWPYAAIRSVEDEDTQEGGVTHARGGVFKTHFGEENTYCIYSAGGTMTVGTSGSAGGPAFEAVGSGVCIAMTGASDNVSEGGSLTISGGTFSSRLGNTIEMENGNMTVTAGSFTKSDGKGIERDQLEDQTAMIDMRGGTLNITGDNADSVTMTAGGKDKPLENVFGILAHGGGEVSVGGCTFNIYGNYSAGVLSYDGTINLNDDTVINVRETHPEDKITSAGVSSEQASEGEEQASEGAEEHPVNLTGNVKITSDGLGITARGNVNIKKAPDNQSATQVNVETGYATGVYVNGGTFKMESGAEISVESTVQNGYTWGLPPEGQGTSPNIYNGVYVQGGSLVSEGTLNVTFTGVQNDAYGSGANSNLKDNTAYRDFQIKSYAVRVEAAASGGDTKVSIAGGTISNSVGGGVYVGGGKVTLGVENGNTGPTVQTTGTSVETEERDPFGYGGNWKYKLPQTGGPAVKVAGGESTTIYGGTYIAQQGDGIVTTGGSATIYQGTFYGNDSYDTKAGPGASYSFKVYGGTVTVKDGTFGNSTANGGGAFVAGTAQETAEAQINGGSFLSGGQAAFSILDNATVTFGENKAANITVQGSKAGLVLEGYSGIGSPEITINGGNFSSTSTDENESSAIWSGNPNFKLTINGGELNGRAKDGIFIARRTWNDESDPFIGTLKITGGEITGNTHGLNLDRDIKSENAVEISGNAVLTGSNGSGLNLAGALYAMHAVVITGGTFDGGQYGAYYGKDGGDDGVYINDGLLIMGGTFTGPTSAGAGFFFGDNPWSQKVEGVWPFQTETPYNNVAIVGGTFSSFGANDDTITAGDVFTMHVEYNGVEQYGVDVGNGVYGNVGAGGGKAVMELNKITLTPTTNS